MTLGALPRGHGARARRRAREGSPRGGGRARSLRATRATPLDFSPPVPAGLRLGTPDRRFGGVFVSGCVRGRRARERAPVTLVVMVLGGNTGLWPSSWLVAVTGFGIATMSGMSVGTALPPPLFFNLLIFFFSALHSVNCEISTHCFPTVANYNSVARFQEHFLLQGIVGLAWPINPEGPQKETQLRCHTLAVGRPGSASCARNGWVGGGISPRPLLKETFAAFVRSSLYLVSCGRPLYSCGCGHLCRISSK